MALKNLIKYVENSGIKALVVDGDEKTSAHVSEQVEKYFLGKKIELVCDRAKTVKDAVTQLKYYDYDVALVAVKISKTEKGRDFLEAVRKRKYDFPAILYGEEADREEAFKSAETGVVGYFSKSADMVKVIPEMVEGGIIMFRSMMEQANLNLDLVEKNKETKAVNELLARQSVRLIKLRKGQEQQRQKMESILHSMSDAVVFLNGRGEIEMINPAGRRAFRLVDDAKFDLDDLKALAGVNPLEIEPGVEIPLALFSRHYRLLSSEVKSEGDKIGHMLVLHDVTRDMEMERIKAEFQSMVSHELRTPLSAIRGAVENFLRGALGPVNEQQKNFLEMILRNVDRQTALVNDILDLAKLEAKMMTIRPEIVDPTFIVRLAYESFRYLCQEKGVEFSMKLGDDIPHVYADENMLTQITDNLLSNAVKFTPSGGRITLEAGKTNAGGDEAVFFSVSDTGIGVPEHLRERIFESYFQADSGVQRQYKGTGLGLSISRKMAELQSGTLVCTSADGGGTRFVLTIPQNLARRKRVLLISEAKHAAMDEEILGREFNVAKETAQSAAIEKITQNLPQLVVADFATDNDDAVKIFGLLKQTPQTDQIPVIFMGTNMSEKEKVQLLKMGAEDVISRPYTAGEFLARVKKIMGEAI